MVSGLYFKDSQNETRIADSDAVALRFLAVLPKLNRSLFYYSHLFSSAVHAFLIRQHTKRCRRRHSDSWQPVFLIAGQPRHSDGHKSKQSYISLDDKTLLGRGRSPS